MKKTVGLIGALALLWVPLAALAQVDGSAEDGGAEDRVAQHDAAVADARVNDARVNDSAVADAMREDASVSCGAITYIGECQGDSVRFCLSGQLRTVDCVDRYGSNATCGLLDCTDSSDTDCQGYWCVPQTGTSCTGELKACDVSAQEGCLAGVCETSQSCDPDTFTPTCSGTVVTTCGYTINNKDCAAGGRPFTCGPTSSGRNGCLGQAGATCDTAQGSECQPPLSCVAGVCGTPQPDAGQPPLDAGAVAADAGTGGGDDSCGCRGIDFGASTFAIAVALLGLALLRRRR